ncbi:hypothetical protein [Flavobacterium restrictum]|uniref:Uncharacterized protein n=1 Tax=Flavobacterium restrictum TaxID=2594428 RepID=A0A553DMJ0_9FLAO|nr:hypothetical protein [Flavobacterium restrictum]TRX33988.1 hypothetical protein FNW21_16060 [Flavobacterium restrictum]
MRRIITFIFLIFTTLNLFSQELKYRGVEYYFDIVKKSEFEELKKVGILNDSLKITEKFKEKGKESFNKIGRDKYFDIKTKVLQSIFKYYLFQQFIEYENDVYILYFSMAGFDDTEWQILKWKKEEWNKNDKIDKKLVENCKFKFEDNETSKECNFTPIAFNYDEGPKNLNDVKIFIKNNFLVMERGNLYHTLYDLKNNKLIINNESPWTSCKGKDKEEMNKWIKENLHNKIEEIINK